MKCLNMKLRDVLFFIVNFIAIYSMNVPLDKNVQTVNEQTFYNDFDKYCPYLSRTIRDNNLTDYTLNCKPLSTKHLVLNEENVLGFACLIVKKILGVMCINKLNMTSDHLLPQNFSTLCPFNFSHLETLGFSFNNNQFVGELENPDHCKEVCRDLYSTKLQCIVLGNFNNYYKSIRPVPMEEVAPTAGVVASISKAEHPEVTKQNTENSVINTVQDKVQHLKKNDTKEVPKKEKVELKTETTEARVSSTKSDANEPIKEEKKTETAVSLTPVEEDKTQKQLEIPESEKKISDDENFLPENIESKQKNEDLNEEEDMVNEDDSSSIAEPIPMKTDFNQVPKLPKLETPEFGMDSLKGKEIYTGEGFFQAEDSHFFFYFIMVSSIIVVGYLAFHNKNKILAYALEGANSRRSRRRPNPARYRKLETNLEEVISSNTTNAASSNVVY